MIALKDWMNCVNYRITEGSEYGWKCYGNTVYTLDSWDQSHTGVSSHVVFDTTTQEVYEATVVNYSTDKSYRFINPEYVDAYRAECTSRGIDFSTAWDDVNHIDLELSEDFLEKCQAIMNYEDYDNRVSIPLTLPDDEMLVLMKMAHERDITLNQFIEEVLRSALDNKMETENV